MRVNASDAACLIGRSEKTVREWCASGKLPAVKVSKMGEPPQWEIELEDLLALPVNPARLRLWEAWVDVQRARLNPGRTFARAESKARETSTLPVATGTSNVSARHIPGLFGTRAAAAQWLMKHGVQSENTPKSWPGWREVELTPRAVLELAQRVCDPANWRITWRLHPCADDPLCVCRELL